MVTHAEALRFYATIGRKADTMRRLACISARAHRRQLRDEQLARAIAAVS